jgi:aerobic carbon-monoxide dehydrogenase large subunit
MTETYVGKALPRREDARILRGEGRYVDDVRVDDALHVAFVRSPLAHARIAGVRVPDGVVALTAAELDVRDLPVQVPDGVEVADAAHPVLARDEVRYAGQPVVLVAAATRAEAEDAAELVEVEYEPLEPVLDARAAPETLLRFSRRGGDVDGAFTAAAHVACASLRIPRIVTTPIEPRGAVAVPDGERLTVWVSAQDPHRQRAGLAHALGCEVDVRVPDVGGAFGSKGVAAPETAALSAAALRLGRPLRWTEDRAENFLAAYQGRGLEGDVELALDGAGRMLAVRARLWADLGAYLVQTTAIPPHTAAMLMTGCYAIDAADVELVGARTNRVPTGPSRGAGRPEAALLLERTVDVAARELGVDPVELRRRNLIRSFPHATPLGWTYDSGDYERCLDRAVELVEPERSQDGRHLVGTGVALYVERAGGLWEHAEAEVVDGGRVAVRVGSSPHGQGHETTFAQIAAEELGVALDDVDVSFGVAGVGTFASRSVAMGGSAVAEACRQLREQGGARGWNELVGARAEARFESPLVFSAGCYAAVVEVDRATGVLRVLRIAAVDDAGRIVNPLLAEGQVIGGAVFALGECLLEEAVLNEDGQPQSVSFAAYPLPTSVEIPEIRAAFVETLSPHNPLGAKGIGEGGTIGTLPAVANAVVDALGGIAVDPPFTAEKLWEALR